MRRCIHGHAMTPSNTYVRPGGGQVCRQCKRNRAAASRRRRGIPERQRAVCGSESGYQRHRKMGQGACEQCRTAHSEYVTNYVKSRSAVTLALAELDKEAPIAESWRSRAACRGVLGAVFFPGQSADDMDDATARIATAKAICGACSVRESCLEWAMTTREKDGVWGGLTARERKQLRRRKRSVA